MRLGERIGLEAVVAVFADERDRWPLWLPVGLGIGIALYFALTVEPPPWLGAAAGLAALAVWRLLRRIGVRTVAVDVVALSCVVAAAGFMAAQVRTAMVAAPRLDRPIGPVTVAGVVDGIDIRTDGVRLVIADVSIDGDRSERTPDRVRVRFRGDYPAVRVGDRIATRAMLRPPPPPSLPGGFDFQRQSYFAGLGAVGYGVGPFRMDEDGGPRRDAVVAQLRAAVIERIHQHLDGDTAAVAIALMTGERGAIDDPMMAAIRDSGLAHLLAISGLHVGLVAGVLFFGTRAALTLVPALALNAPIKKWAAVVAVAGAAAYTVLTGATVPTQRAFLMIALVFLGVLIDRRGLSMRMVAWAAVVILLVTPESLLTASFQLSFAAVVALIAVYEKGGALPEAWSGGGDLPRRILLYVGGVALTTVVASSATTPYVVYHFSRVAVYGLAANIIAVPVTALWVMPLIIAAFALMPFGLEGLALVPMSWGIDAVIRVGEAVAHWPGAVSLIPPMPTWGLGAVTLGGLWLCLWQRRWRWFGTLGIAAGVLGLIVEAPPDVLISDTGQLIAVRTADGGLSLSSRRVQRFQRDAWIGRVAAAGPPPVWPAAGLSADGRLGCDPLGCLYRRDERVVAFIRRPEAAIEDCPVADVVVTTTRLPPGCAPRHGVIDRWRLRDGGVHALWLDGAGVRIDSVARRRGDRPWVIRPPKREAGPPGDASDDGDASTDSR